ncbi:helix-turn-helix domain-containing protein [Nocardia sp. NPDC058658]|uniref:helix-turn-helix domain-containing protein n=1 Tax=Nocardia sp. NPDC058658 TaxID=3346580 RepID=UPI00365681C6
MSTRHDCVVRVDEDQLEDPDLLRQLGDCLRRLREQSGKSQDTLANDSGLHRTYVGAVERGERNPTYLTLVKYARGLGITVTDLVAGLQ